MFSLGVKGGFRNEFRDNLGLTKTTLNPKCKHTMIAILVPALGVGSKFDILNTLGDWLLILWCLSATANESYFIS